MTGPAGELPGGLWRRQDGPTPAWGSVPVPDPTKLTTEQLFRELATLRELLEARMDASDDARTLLLQLMDERRDHIDRRFAERDIRGNERDIDRQAAVELALSAAKSLSDERDRATDLATAKFETTVREQIAQIGTVSEAGRAVLDGKIAALKERMDRGEGSTAGVVEQRTERRLDRTESISTVVAVVMSVSVIISIVSVILVVVLHK